jgi:hypothetical protein
MRPWIKLIWQGVQYVADCIVLLACWALWIGLAGLIFIQLKVAFSRELAVPDFVLRSIEARFTASQINARFGRATFDPEGRILLENLTLASPDFDEPIVTVRAALLDLNPWMLLNGELETRRVRATGVTVSIPAMLAPSGRNEAMLTDFDLSVVPTEEKLTIDHLTARIAGVALRMHGAFQLPPPERTAIEKTTGFDALPLIETLAKNYPQFCRQLIRARAELAAFEQPQLEAHLVPSSRGALANLSVMARQLRTDRFSGIDADDLKLMVVLPLLDQSTAPSPLLFTAEELRVGNGVTAQAITATINGTINPEHFYYTPDDLQVTASRVSAKGFSLESVAAQGSALSRSEWDLSVLALCAGSAVDLHGRTDLTAQTAEFDVKGAFAPALLDPIGERLGKPVRRFIDFGEPVIIDLDVSFAAGWRFERIQGHVSARHINAYRVPIDAASGQIEFDGKRFFAHDAMATLGENTARGSFEQDLRSKQFRFLLAGNLRPLDISGWFGEWWPNFFEHLQFPQAPPAASVDVAGRWFSGYETTVFVFAESEAPILRGTSLDYARTLMFIRPNFFHGLEFHGTKGNGQVAGNFVRRIDLERGEWSGMSFDLTSTLDTTTGLGLLGSTLAARLEPIKFATSPLITARGQLDGPAASGGEHQTVMVEAKSTGGFSIFDFPAQNVSFEASLRDDDITVERIQADVAGGRLTGRAQVTGLTGVRGLSFDASLRDSLLSEAVAIVSEYSASRRGQSEAATEQFVAGKSEIKMDLDLAAAGSLDNLLSYRGTGTAVLTGAELGQVRLLGLLSELLDFTALRFNTARLNYAVEGAKVVFPTLSVTGEHSAIEGRGEYSLNSGEIDFNARVYPFQEGKSLFQNVVGAVLLPLSTALEVKLTGQLQQPKWAFVLGPTNFFRALTQSAEPVTEDAPTTGPSPYLKR